MDHLEFHKSGPGSGEREAPQSLDRFGRRQAAWSQVLLFSIAYWSVIPLAAFVLRATIFDSRPLYFDWRHVVLGPILFFVVEWSVGAAVFTLVFGIASFLLMVQPVAKFNWDRVILAFLGTVVWLSAGLFMLASGIT
jgi:hypothetical protein